MCQEAASRRVVLAIPAGPAAPRPPSGGTGGNGGNAELTVGSGQGTAIDGRGGVGGVAVAGGAGGNGGNGGNSTVDANTQLFTGEAPPAAGLEVSVLTE
ncbi:hypothetical protein AB3G41_17105 [Mycobacterium kansasii]